MRLPADVAHQLAVIIHRAQSAQSVGQTWDVAGLAAKIAECDAPPLDTIQAVAALASDPTMRTPGMLPKPGRHWPSHEHAVGPRVARVDWCPEHPDTVRAECTRHDPPATPEQIRAAREEARRLIAERRPAEQYHAEMQRLRREQQQTRRTA